MSAKTNHTKRNIEAGVPLCRFWASQECSVQQDLFFSDEKRTILINGKQVLYHLMDSTQPDDPTYKQDPYPQWNDKKFLGFGDLNHVQVHNGDPGPP